MVGETLSHYRIEEKLGQGGMGVVYRARDTRLDRVVALKMVLPELAGDATLRRRLATEARAVSLLNHPVIATVYDFDEAAGSAFIVYEYVEGTTLRELLRSRPLSVDEALSIAVRVADGLAAAHEAGIVHRDIKPDNIMLAGAGRVKILDFGLAKLRPAHAAAMLSGAEPAATATATLPGTLLGTVSYMSPEQLESGPVDHRTDVFSFGVTLYEMATRQHPFAGKTPISTISSILKDEPPQIAHWTPNVPADLDRVIRKCLRKNPAERYQSTRDLVVDLESIRREQTGQRPAVALPAPISEQFRFPRGAARGLTLLIQAGYLGMYGVALTFADDLAARGMFLLVLLLVSALCGIAVRLYLVSAVGLDHPAAGVQFRKIFPLVLLLDEVWAAAPLLLWNRIGWGAALGCVVAMAYLPFSQRTLINSAYPPRAGERTSSF